MLSVNISFGILWIACCAYAWLIGGWEGRVSAALLSVAALVTPVVLKISEPYRFKNEAMLGVDTALLIALGIIAYRSDRYWPLWLVGLHLLTICAEIAVLVEGPTFSGPYEAMQAFWSIPVLIVLALGNFLDKGAERRSLERTENAPPSARE